MYRSPEQLDPQKAKDLVPLGKITKAQGLKGGFRLRAHSVQSESLPSLKTLIVKNTRSEFFAYSISAVQPRKDFYIVFLKGLNRIEQTEPLIGLQVFALPDEIAPLEDDDFFWYQLVGLKAVTTEGRNLGTVRAIIPTGANDVLQVKDERGKELLLPYIDHVVLEVNLDTGTITIDPIPGLLED